MRKILAAALVCAVYVFADWHQFPIIGEGMGEAKTAVYQSRKGNIGQGPSMDYFRLRYSPVANLELLSEASLKTGANHTLGARYQIIPALLSAGVNIGVPVPKTNWNFTPHIQFSTPVTSTLTLGSFARMTINTEDATDYTRGMDFRAGIELDQKVGQKSILWVGGDIGKGLTKSEDADGDVSRKKENRGLGIYPAFGYLIVLGNLSLGTLAVLGFGEDAGNDPFSTTVGASASVKF
ncbi:MAG: transporter [Candidatus Fibromonas sp.]|jgi:hypothetical protein|nr:transporter [Candidatus Fibromonas sp.]